MQFADRLEICQGRLNQVAEDLESVAAGRELSIGPSLAQLYADWLRELADLVTSLAR